MLTIENKPILFIMKDGLGASIGADPLFVDFNPTLNGLTLTIPAWTFLWYAGTIDLPAITIDFTPDPAYTKDIRLYVVPTPDGVDNYHLEEMLMDGFTNPSQIEGFPDLGMVLILWGTLAPNGTEPALTILRHYQ